VIEPVCFQTEKRLFIDLYATASGDGLPPSLNFLTNAAAANMLAAGYLAGLGAAPQTSHFCSTRLTAEKTARSKKGKKDFALFAFFASGCFPRSTDRF
jgi:hypothetical protein